MVDPIIATKRLTKVLMDRGNSLNIMYVETLDAMGINRTHIRPEGAPFHGVVPGKQAVPVTFGAPSDFRMETLTFEVVGFHRTYHAILGRPCYTKFMAVPNYIYMKLKMSGPHDIIIVGTSVQRAYECEVEFYEFASTLIASEGLLAVHQVMDEEAPDTKKTVESFKLTEDTKEVVIDPSNSKGKMVHIGTALS
jgi:hypothetical protein